MPEYRQRFGADGGTPTVSLDAIMDAGRDPGLPEGTPIRIVPGYAASRQADVAPPRGTYRRSTFRRLDEQPENPALESAMRPFLDNLTIPQRDALRLIFWERLTFRDAAARLNIDRKSLFDRLEGAEKALRKAFEADGLGTDYRDVRQGLTPAEDLAKFHTARCVDCGTPVAQYRPNALGLLPALLCPDHGTAR